MTEAYHYSAIFEDHMNIARELFIQENGRDPTTTELIQRLNLLEYYFYD